MTDLLSGPSFDALFEGVERSAQRLETRSAYAGDRALLEAWSVGAIDQPPSTGARGAWLARVRRTVARGGRYERVRVVDEPPSLYQRFALRSAGQNVSAGEDVGYLVRGRADSAHLPDHDFWLLDSERVALLYFTADDRLLGAQVVLDGAVVRQHARWFAAARELATPYEDFRRARPEYERRPG